MSCTPLWPAGRTLLADDDEPTPLPPAEALLAATLALMTGVVERAALAQPLAAHGQSLLMASKARVHLRGLVDHPQLSEPFRATLRRLAGHWDRLVDAGTAPRADSGAGWHRAPSQLQ